MYDFAGWVTKNDIRCSDGAIIKQDAFKENHSKQVPMVWAHNHSTPNNVLGHIRLQNEPEGVYGFGYFNDTEEAKSAKELVKHGDISAMSIGARNIKRKGSDVIHGRIYEVSLVLAGANPGAVIDSVMAHGDDGEEEAIIYNGYLLHSSEDIVEKKKETIEHKEEKETDKMADKTVGDVIKTLNEEQMNAVEILLASIVEGDEDIEQSYNEGGEDMKHNVFSDNGQEVLQHADMGDVLQSARDLGSLKEGMLEHSITNIELLFPEAQMVQNQPHILKDYNTAAIEILDGTRKSPFARVKTIAADLTEEEARAKGYIKGAEKLEQVFSLLTRETLPQTIYKKQKLDRDDIIDITDFDVVGFINMEMKMMLKEEIARALMVGDGRLVGSPDKIKEDKIRPIIKDDDLYTIKKTAATVGDLIEVIIKALSEYRGSGTPNLYLSPLMMAELRLMKKTDGSYLFGDIPTPASIAARLGVNKLVPTSFLKDDECLLVNLADYTIGATKGGEITNFDDFDIDFNQYKYLIETRLSGALTIPKSAIYVKVSAAAGASLPTAEE